MKRAAIIHLAALCAVALALAGCDKEKDENTGANNKVGKGTEPKDTASKDDTTGDTANKAAEPGEAGATKGAMGSTPAVEPDPWTSYDEPEYGFSVDAPVAPEKDTQQVPTVVGTFTAYSFAFNPPGANGAMIAMVTPNYVDEKEVDVKQVLDDGQNGSLNSMGGTLTSSEDIEMEGSPGRVFRFTARPQGMAASGYVKVFLRDSTLYQVMMVTADSDKAFKADGERFVDSFRFVPKKGA